MASLREEIEVHELKDNQGRVGNARPSMLQEKPLKRKGGRHALSVLRISACLLVTYIVFKMFASAGRRWPRLWTIHEGPSHEHKYLLGVGKADITGFFPFSLKAITNTDLS